MINLILILALVLRLINLNQSFWLDEIAQVVESSRPFSQQWQIPIDFHPPLFHYLVHFWLLLGKSECWLRSSSVILGVLAVYFLYLLVKKLTSKKIAIFSSLLLATSPFHIYYSQELRPYSLACLLGIVSMYLFLKLLEKKSWFMPFVLINILGVYTLYFFPFVLVAQLFILLFLRKERLLDWLKNVLIAVLFFLPWVPLFLSQLQTGREWARISPVWLSMVSASREKALGMLFAKFFLGRITFDNKLVYLILTLASFLVFAYLLKQAWQKKKKAFVFLFGFFFVPIIFSFLIHLILPVVSPKRLLIVLPAFYGLISLGIASLSRKYQKLGLAFFLLLNIYGLMQQNFNPRFQREQWRQATAFIEEKAQPEALVLFQMPAAGGGWDWYQERDLVVKYLSDSFEGLTKNHPQVFVFQYLFELVDLEQQIFTVLTQEGFERVRVYDFPGVGLIYEFKKNN